MKKLLWSLLALAVVGLPTVRAQEKKPDETKPAPRAQEPRRQGSALLQFGRTGPLLSDKDIEELKLSSDQKDKVTKLVKDYDAKQKELSDEARKLREGGNVDREKMRASFEARTKARQEATEKLKVILNDDQKKKLDELQRTRRNTFPGGFGQRGQAFTPGTVLPSALKTRLDLNDDQKKQIEALEKKVKDELNKILTEDQKKRLEQAPTRPGTGNRPAQPGQPRRPRNDQ